MKIGNRSKKQKKTLANINKLFSRRNDAIKFIDGYGLMILEAKRKAPEEEPKPEPTKAKTKRKISPFKLHEKCINEIKNDENNINEQIFKEYLFYNTALFSAKELYSSNQNDNDKIVKHSNDLLIKLKKDINVKKIPKNQNPNKIVHIVEKILNFNKQQKRKGIPLDLPHIARVAKVFDHFNVKILTPKQML